MMDVKIWCRIDPSDIRNGSVTYQDLLESGYPRVHLPNAYGKWTDIHAWCELNVGKEYYTWVSNVFFFVHDADAIQFTLAWA